MDYFKSSPRKRSNATSKMAIDHIMRMLDDEQNEELKQLSTRSGAEKELAPGKGAVSIKIKSMGEPDMDDAMDKLGERSDAERTLGQSDDDEDDDKHLARMFG
mgnify:CR=1 FL=1